MGEEKYNYIIVYMDYVQSVVDRKMFEDIKGVIRIRKSKNRQARFDYI
jgi:hypothetical protein